VYETELVLACLNAPTENESTNLQSPVTKKYLSKRNKEYICTVAV
jgi:hypothetical protein